MLFALSRYSSASQQRRRYTKPLNPRPFIPPVRLALVGPTRSAFRGLSFCDAARHGQVGVGFASATSRLGSPIVSPGKKVFDGLRSFRRIESWPRLRIVRPLLPPNKDRKTAEPFRVQGSPFPDLIGLSRGPTGGAIVMARFDHTRSDPASRNHYSNRPQDSGIRPSRSAMTRLSVPSVCLWLQRNGCVQTSVQCKGALAF